MPDWYKDVLDFHDKFVRNIGETPKFPSMEEQDLREDLIYEEYQEMLVAWGTDDFVRFADGITDLIYVLIGTAISFGIPLNEVWDEVHRTNMLKVGGTVREDGKILKPEGWEPPDIEGILRKYGHDKI